MISSLVFFNISGNRETFTTNLTKKTNLVLLRVSNYCSCRGNVSNYDCALMTSGKTVTTTSARRGIDMEFWRVLENRHEETNSRSKQEFDCKL